MKKKIQDGLWILLSCAALVCAIYTISLIIMGTAKGVEKASEQAYHYAIEKAAKISKDLEEAKK